MSDDESKANAVRAFLLDMKLAVARGNWTMAQRDKNLRDLAALGLLMDDVVRILQSLSVDDYCQGPLADDKGQPKEWWVFGPVYQGTPLYVKLCINSRRYVECLSFHGAEDPMEYPLRKGGHR